MGTHASGCTCPCTHKCACTPRARAHSCIHTRGCAHAQVFICAHAHTQACTYTDMRASTHVRRHPCTRARRHVHTHMCMHRRARLHMQACAHVHPDTCPHTFACRHTQACTQTHACMHTPLHAHPPTCACTLMHPGGCECPRPPPVPAAGRVDPLCPQSCLARLSTRTHRHPPLHTRPGVHRVLRAPTPALARLLGRAQAAHASTLALARPPRCAHGCAHGCARGGGGWGCMCTHPCAGSAGKRWPGKCRQPGSAGR